MVLNNSAFNDRKDKYLKEALLESETCHLENNPLSLICPISRDFMLNPVITPDGFVYDKAFIVKSLQIKKEDPQSRSPLEIKDLKSFQELVPIIEKFICRKNNYLELKTQIIQEARTIAHHKPPIENPALFICPLNNKLIKDPVITSKGKIYDKQSLKEFLKHSGNKDELGKPLSLKDVIEFDEFLQQIKVYNFYLNKQIKPTSPSPVNASNCNFFNLRNLVSWILPVPQSKSSLPSNSMP